MTRFEARFYLQNEEAIWYLGRAGGSIEQTPQQIISGQARDFLNSLFDSLFDALKMNPTIKFERTETTKFRVFFARGRNEMIIYLWVGERDPEPKVLSSEYRPELNLFTYAEKSATIPKDKRAVPGWFYQMEQGAQFFLMSTETFLVLINQYLKKSSVQDHQALLDHKHFLRFWMMQSELYLPPTVVGYLVPVEEIPASHQEELKGASPEQLLCEMNGPDGRGYYFRVDKEKWSRREPITNDDIDAI